MNETFSAYGLWWAVAINSLIFIAFAFSFFRPKSPRDWRTFGAFSAFLVALFTEMYGFPLTIYLFSGWLSSRFPGIDWYAHDSGHLLEMMFGWGGNPHVGPFHLLSSVFVFGGFILLAFAWRVLYRAQRERTLATSGAYALVRHPQYLAFISIMFGFLLQWPTLPTLVLFPLLVLMYLRLARREERDSSADFGEVYRRYRDRTPAFIPRFGDALKLAAFAVFLLAAPSVIAYITLPQPEFVAGGAQPGEGAERVEATPSMGTNMNREGVDVAGLQKQMERLADTNDPALRRDLIRAHLDDLRLISDSMQGMNLEMIEDVDKGKVVSDPGLKQRLQLGADVMSMQREMLEAQAGTGDARAAAAVTDETGAQR